MFFQKKKKNVCKLLILNLYNLPDMSNLQQDYVVVFRLKTSVNPKQSYSMTITAFKLATVHVCHASQISFGTIKNSFTRKSKRLPSKHCRMMNESRTKDGIQLILFQLSVGYNSFLLFSLDCFGYLLTGVP